MRERLEGVGDLSAVMEAVLSALDPSEAKEGEEEGRTDMEEDDYEEGLFVHAVCAYIRGSVYSRSHDKVKKILIFIRSSWKRAPACCLPAVRRPRSHGNHRLCPPGGMSVTTTVLPRRPGAALCDEE